MGGHIVFYDVCTQTASELFGDLIPMNLACRRFFLLLCIQMCGVGLAILGVHHVSGTLGAHTEFLPFIGSTIQIGCVAGLAYCLDSTESWYRVWMHMLLAAGLCLTKYLPVLPLFYLGAFCLGWCVFGLPTPGRVPLLITHTVARRTLCQMWRRDSVHHAIDMGSGTGCILRDWAKQYPYWQITGIESALFPCLYSRWAVRHSQHVCVLHKNFWHHPLASYDVIYAFLSPELMTRLWQCVTQQCRKGTTLVSFCFSVPDTVHTSMVAISPHKKLFVYVVPG